MTNQPVNPGWRMGGVTVPEVEDYLYAMLPARDEVLTEMEDDASKNDVSIVGPAVARVLYQLAAISGAKKVFEMGSAIGYSTIWWARAVGEGGRVVYTDGDPKRAEKARRYFDRAGVSQRITVRVGDALEILSEQKEPYDIIFNDVDKTDYPRVFRLALARLKRGGLFISDNVLWSGKLQPAQTRRRNQSHPRIQQTDVRIEGVVYDHLAHSRWSLRWREEVGNQARDARTVRC